MPLPLPFQGVSRSPLGHRAPVAWLLLPFMGGLIAGKLSPGPLPVAGLIAASLAAVLLAMALAGERPGVWGLAMTLGLVALGAAYYEIRRERLPEWDRLPVREARLSVQVTRVFASSSDDRFSGLGRIIGTDPHLHDLQGQAVALSLSLPPGSIRPFRGALIRAIGVLEVLPRRSARGGFEAYLVASGINFRLSRGPAVEVLEAASAYARWRERLRRRAIAQLGLGLDDHPVMVSALRGMLLGERAELSGEQRNLYLRSGAMHLFAISGLHIAVIAGGIITLLRLTRMPSGATFLLGSAALAFYVDLTGALPSAIRAWLMVVCLHGASILRAPGNAVSALVTSALLVLLLDPMQLFGAGFQMSYAIVAALLLYGLPLRDYWITRGALWPDLPVASWSRWHRVMSSSWQWLQSGIAINVAASLAGTISSVGFFGIFTPAGLLVNLLLIPLASGAIFAGFASLIAGGIGLAWLSLIFNHAAAMIIILMQAILQAVVALPGAANAAHFRAEWIGSAGLALLVGIITWGYAGGWARDRGGYWPPVACLALALVLGMQFD